MNQYALIQLSQAHIRKKGVGPRETQVALGVSRDSKDLKRSLKIKISQVALKADLQMQDLPKDTQRYLKDIQRHSGDILKTLQRHTKTPQRHPKTPQRHLKDTSKTPQRKQKQPQAYLKSFESTSQLLLTSLNSFNCYFNSSSS